MTVRFTVNEKATDPEDMPVTWDLSGIEELSQDEVRTIMLCEIAQALRGIEAQLGQIGSNK